MNNLAETAIPIGLALMQKGVKIGAVIALIIGGAHILQLDNII